MEIKIPLKQKAVKQADADGILKLYNDSPLPELKAGQVLIKTMAVALNPCDWKMPTNFPCKGAVDGSDFSGTVVALGKDLGRALEVGDRVAGAVHASNPLNPTSGAFAEYLAAWADQLWKMPDSMQWDQGAAIGWCVTGTVGLAMFKSLKLPGSPEKPVQKPAYVLVYGGSTASGTMAIQLLKISGFKVVTTCSPKNFAMVESYGAEKAFDYNSPSCAEDIRAYTKNTLQYVIDIIAEVKSIRICYAAIGRAGGRYCGFELVPEELVKNMRKTVKADWILGITMSGNKIDIGGGYGSEANPELRVFGCDLFLRLEAQIHAGRIRPHPIALQREELSGVVTGVERMKRRDVSGEKLVYKLDGSKTNGATTAESLKKSSQNGTVTAAKLMKSTSIPREHSALKVTAPGEVKLSKKVEVPHFKEDEVLVNVHYVGLNQVDPKSIDLSPVIGATAGCDFSGKIVAIGSAVKPALSVGDGVCGAVFGNNSEAVGNGAYAEYVAVPGKLVYKIPSGMSYQTASTLGIGLSTIGLALYHKTLTLPLPTAHTPKHGQSSKYVFVYGGGTASGIIAIQAIRQSGMVPITSCSPKSYSLAKEAGAVKTFDYQSKTCGDDIRKYTNNELEYVLDCIGSVGSVKICYAAISSKGGKYMSLEAPPAKLPRQDIEAGWIITFTMFNQKITWRKPFTRDPQPEDRRFAEDWFNATQKLLDAGLIVPLPIEERPGGLSGVIEGLDDVRKHKVERVKRVYSLK